MNNPDLFKKTFDELSKTIRNFNKNQEEWSTIISLVKNNYHTDFSVLLKQNIVDMFNSIHESKEKVLLASLLFLKSCEDIKNLHPEIVVSANKIRNYSNFVVETKYSDMFINYGLEANKLIEYLKSSESEQHVDKLEHSLAVYQLWCDLIHKTNQITDCFDAISIELIKISIITLKYGN